MPLNKSQIEDAFSATDEDVKTLLSNILILNLEENNSSGQVIGTINKLLSVSKNRLQGLEFLNLIINNCSSTIISENAFTWMSHCLVEHPGDNLKEVKLSTIGKIVENVHREQEFNKKFISEYISKILENCLSDHVNSHESEAALETLSICMKHYGSWFVPHKVKIESFLINLLENSSEGLVEKAAVAFHYLQQTGRAGVDGLNYKTNFSTSFGKLCATLQKLFDKFFENETEIDHSNRSNQDGFEFIDLPHYTQKMLHITARRIRNCLKFIMAMLIKGFPAAKDIKPIEVLDIINRGTAFHQCLSMGNEKTLQDFQFSLLLNKIQVQLLQLLGIFITWGQANLLPFSFSIGKILIDCLKKSQNCDCFKTDGIYQEVVYKVLGSWLRISKNSLPGNFQTQLVTCIVKDITPVANPVTLTLQNDPAKHKSTKAKRRAIQEKIILSGHEITSTDVRAAVKHYQEETCLCALDTLKHLFSASTLRIDPDVVKILCTSIIGTINDIQISKFNHPYTNEDCQAKLYEAFVMFYEHDTLKAQPPLKFALGILSKGVNNKNRHIALTCEYGLTLLEKLCQPVCPSLLSLDTFSAREFEEGEAERFDDNDDENVDELSNQTETRNGNEEIGESIEQILQVVNENVDTTTEVNLRETNIEFVTDTHEEIVADTNNEEEAQQSLLNGRSIHILDVQVVKSSNDEAVTENTNIPDTSVEGAPVPDDKFEQKDGARSIEKEDFALEVSIFKKEILSETSINIPKSPPGIENAEIERDDDEPPPKKSRSENESEDFMAAEIKLEPTEEAQKSEEIDDRFEEDDAFVDEVKKY